VKTLGEALNSRNNSVNAIRLAFAGSIIVLHAMALGGYVDEMPKLIFHETFGTYMLAGFFVISGYMITASRLASRGFGDYLWRRLLRIYPAWIASFVLVAVVLGPLSLLIQGRPLSSYDWGSAAGYVYKNLYFRLNQFDITGTIEGIPFERIWNYSAWTLFYEFALWMCIGILVLIAPKKLLNPGIIAGLVVFTAIKVFDKVTNDLSQFGTANPGRSVGAIESNFLTTLMFVLEPLARLGIFFFAGALLYVYRDKVKISWLVFWISVAISMVLGVIGWFHVFAALPWAYVIMHLGTSTRLSRVNYPNDYSYGTYIYAFPITQVLALIALEHPMPGWLFCTLAVLATAPLAWLSWHVLEKPAMSLKRLTAGKDKAIIGVP
jgi:peptidoglycan/LPS O-acetylase OafA/YrhL